MMTKRVDTDGKVSKSQFRVYRGCSLITDHLFTKGKMLVSKD